MRILLIIKNFDLGGAESHVFTLANELVRQKHDVYLISNSGRQVKSLSPMVKHVSLQINNTSVLTRLPFLLNFIKKEKIEVIHGHQRLAIFLSSVLKLITKKPMVATIHGRLKKDLRSYLSKRMVSKVIVVSGNSLKGAKAKKALTNKTIFIPNGTAFQQEKTTKYNSDLTLVYASRINKKHASLINLIVNNVWPKIIQEHPNIRLAIFGDGPCKEEVLHICNQINKQHHEKSVFFNGFSQTNKKNLSNASLVIGSGRTAIEAMIKGIPVLSIHTKYMGKLLTSKNYNDYKYGNFVNLDGCAPEEKMIYDELNTFLSNKEFFFLEAKNLQNQANKDFNIKHVAQQIVEVYKEVIVG
ncbi:glycosyltransferase family 4 protein [Polaribacter sp. MSW13]|uniref:Glycosyltransferase family 4 protein n=1 Tax=Polaribacter marinus TaxID=2916838 RepID=A0A9X2AJY7_9FLAO|nr:glycosyltransferase family 4 protein [Polaribacter marinus]MCI2229512.1 glycosyltransferase family 4 protein [Polaribacter marinus]